MIPVNGKPVIGWILDDLETKKITEVILVLRFDNVRLLNYVEWAFARRFTIHYAFVQAGGTILHSLLAGLAWVKPKNRVHIILGDTLVIDPLPPVDDFVFVGNFENPEDWCLVEAGQDGMVNAYWDKQQRSEDSWRALAGVYSLSNSELVRALVMKCIRDGAKEISALLSSYGAENPIKVVQVNKWYDFGHISDFNRAKRELLQSRYFNSLQIDPLSGRIFKSSQKPAKLADELNWYNELPAHLKIFSPRTKRDDSSSALVIEQEFYGYPNLAELYVFGDVSLSIWKSALDQLIRVHCLFQKEKGDVSAADIVSMYWDKTKERLNQLAGKPFWKELKDEARLRIGNKEYLNYSAMESDIKNRIDDLSKSVKGSVIHGDYCFSNILYDLNGQLVRLVDPRGSFGKRGIYGDPRYDMAKLRHSVTGLYDFIMADLFKVSKGETGYELELFRPDCYEQLAAYFDHELSRIGYEVSEIKFIEGLLFLSMVAYHEGKHERQLAMYLNGIVILNEVLFHENSN